MQPGKPEVPDHNTPSTQEDPRLFTLPAPWHGTSMSDAYLYNFLPPGRVTRFPQKYSPYSS